MRQPELSFTALTQRTGTVFFFFLNINCHINNPHFPCQVEGGFLFWHVDERKYILCFDFILEFQTWG